MKRQQGHVKKIEFATLLATAFPGFITEDAVSGADLVDWMSEHLKVLKQVDNGRLHEKLCKTFHGFSRRSNEIDGSDLVDWMSENFGPEFACQSPRPRLYVGEWTHLFGPGRIETRCRIVIDVAIEELVAAMAFDGQQWLPLSAAERRDLAESLFDANSVSDDPEEWGLVSTGSLPEWVSASQAPASGESSAAG